MLILGIGAAAHISARFADPQVHPAISNFQAVFTNIPGGMHIFDHVQMGAFIGHSF
jgi:hypothetical protein